jgi:hypothetical protein
VPRQVDDRAARIGLQMKMLFYSMGFRSISVSSAGHCIG